jgi:hypothetical protein
MFGFVRAQKRIFPKMWRSHQGIFLLIKDQGVAIHASQRVEIREEFKSSDGNGTVDILIVLARCASNK